MTDTLATDGQRVIVAALNWGLGHASRCVPVIRQLLDQGKQVAIASDGEALMLLQQEFPSLDHFELPSYHIRYKYSSMAANMLLGAPRIFAAIRAERNAAKKISTDWQADTIISDNRLGFRSGLTHNIYLTHQLHVLGNNKLESYLATKLHRQYYQKFDECWVPDHQGNNSLAGQLSDNKGVGTKVRYIGPISRMAASDTTESKYQLLVILSGPEPQRSALESLILSIAADNADHSMALVRGTTRDTSQSAVLSPHITVFDLADQHLLQSLIACSGHLVCRAGYSSIMDLVKMGRGATLIPTPGQTEQEYLAKRLDGKFGFVSVQQKDLVKHRGLLY